MNISLIICILFKLFVFFYLIYKPFYYSLVVKYETEKQKETKATSVSPFIDFASAIYEKNKLEWRVGKDVFIVKFLFLFIIIIPILVEDPFYLSRFQYYKTTVTLNSERGGFGFQITEI